MFHWLFKHFYFNKVFWAWNLNYAQYEYPFLTDMFFKCINFSDCHRHLQSIFCFNIHAQTYILIIPFVLSYDFVICATGFSVLTFQIIIWLYFWKLRCLNPKLIVCWSNPIVWFSQYQNICFQSGKCRIDEHTISFVLQFSMFQVTIFIFYLRSPNNFLIWFFSWYK